MLVYVLALMVGLGSIALYLAAFFFPEIHRKNDFIWSGVGMFYALVLWVCAGQITGGVLLGQVAGVALLVWFGWQTVTLRRQVTPLNQQTTVPSSNELKTRLSNLASPETISQVQGQLGGQVSRLKQWAGSIASTATKPNPKSVKQPQADTYTYVPLTPADFGPGGRMAMVEEEAIVTPYEPIPATATPLEDADAEQIDTGVEVPRIENAVPPAPQPVTTPAPAAIANQPQKNAPGISGIFGAIQSFFKKLTGKRESKPIYVRKQFRQPEPEVEELEEAELEELEAVLEDIQDEAPEVTTATLEPTSPSNIAGNSTDASVEETVESVSEPSPNLEIPTPEKALIQETDLSGDEIVQEEIAYESTHAAQEPVEERAVPTQLEATPPHAPAPELVGLALEDAEEKDSPADPPPTDAEEGEAGNRE